MIYGMNCSNTHPPCLCSAIKWNFTKFVINKEGVAVARFGPTDDPIPKVEKKVEELL